MVVLYKLPELALAYISFLASSIAMATNPSSKSPARKAAPGSLVIEVVHRVGGKEFPNAAAAEAYVKQVQEQSEDAVRRKFVSNVIARTADRKRAEVRPGVEHLFSMLLARPDLLRDLNTLAADGSRQPAPAKKAPAAPKSEAPKAVVKKQPAPVAKPAAAKSIAPAAKKTVAPKPATTPTPAATPPRMDEFPPPAGK